METRWPTMVESAAWYKDKALKAFYRRHNLASFGGDSRADARYALMDAKRQRDKVRESGDRAMSDPW